MVDQINSWIKNGCNYAEGVGLFEKYSGNNFLLRILKKGETNINRQKLNEELHKLKSEVKGERLKAKEEPKAETLNPEAEEVPLVKPAPPAVPALLQVIRDRENSYAELRGLHPYLHTTPEGPELKDLAKRLVNLGRKNAQLWERQNFLTDNPDYKEPDLPPPPAPVMIDLNLLAKREQLRKNLSKAQGRLKKQDKPKANTLQLIESQKTELKALDERIAELKKGAVQ